MSKLNQIQQELEAIDQARFQKLCDLYLKYQPRYENLKPLGSVIGADKVKKGVPDATIELPGGGYAMANYTTQRTGLLGKLTKDFDDSFDEESTHIAPDQVKEVILCHNGALSTEDELTLTNKGKSRGCVVKPIGLEVLSYDIYQKYPGLAKDFLGVEIDTRQILRPDEFLAEYHKSTFSTRLDTAFHFREEELKKALEGLRASDLVLITGGPGVGKSRFMLEVAARFTNEQPSFEVWCIFRRGPDIFEDIRVYFSKPGDYLILVDDANRLSGNLDYVLQLLHDQTDERHVKIVATVRDYARDKVAKQAAQYGGGVEVQLQPFEDNQIRELVASVTPINNPTYLRRISDLAQGNPRLAMMAARIAVDKDTLDSISDVTSLYDEYFASIRDDLAELGDRDAIKVAGILSFFRNVDRSNHEQMEFIARAFDIPPSRFWSMVEQLHRLEVVDLYDNEIAKFSDQVLATYLFYLTVFKEGLLDFSILLDSFFPRYKSHFIDALNPVINALGARIEEQLRPHVERKWEELRNSDNEEAFIELVRTFWFVDEARTLRQIRDDIEALEPEAVDPTTLDFSKEPEDRSQPLPLLELLGHFHHPNSATALELAFEAFSKRPSATLKAVMYILVRDFGFRGNSYQNDFYYQREVIDRLWVRTEEGRSLLFSRLFIAVAEYYLRTHHDFTEPMRKYAISITRFDLPATPALRELRQLILNGLIQLFKVPALRSEVLALLYKYCHSGYQISGKEIVQWDAEVIVPFLSTSLDPDQYEHTDIVQSYLGFLRREKVEYDESLERRFTTEMSELADMLMVDRLTRTGRRWEDAQRWQTEQIKNYFQGAGPERYAHFFHQCLIIEQHLINQRETWHLRHSLDKVIVVLLESNAEVFVSVLTLYLNMGNPFEIIDRRLITRLIEIQGVEEAYRLIASKEFRKKAQWLFGFYAVLPADQVKPEHLDELYELYRTTPPNEIYLDFDSLERYLPLDDRFILRVVELLLTRIEEEKNTDLGFTLSLLFDFGGITPEKLLRYFGRDNVNVVKRAYLAGEPTRDHADVDGRLFSFILDSDPNFLCEYFDFVVDNVIEKGKPWLSDRDHRRNYAFLWPRTDYAEIILRATEHLFSIQGSRQFYLNDLLADLFAIGEEDQTSESNLGERRVALLEGLIRERGSDGDFMEFIFGVMRELSGNERRTLLALFLEQNQKPEDFKRLPLLPKRNGGWVGSAVPTFQKEVDFFESLLPLVQDVNLLDQRVYLEGRIQTVRRRIEAEKRQNFLED